MPQPLSLNSTAGMDTVIATGNTCPAVKAGRKQFCVFGNCVTNRCTVGGGAAAEADSAGREGRRLATCFASIRRARPIESWLSMYKE
jgi:hypothetical protein